jgi:hypothetical protein
MPGQTALTTNVGADVAHILSRMSPEGLPVPGEVGVLGEDEIAAQFLQQPRKIEEAASWPL